MADHRTARINVHHLTDDELEDHIRDLAAERMAAAHRIRHALGNIPAGPAETHPDATLLRTLAILWTDARGEAARRRITARKAAA